MSLDTIGRLDRFAPIGLDELTRSAELLHRKDRKYVIDAAALSDLLDDLVDEARVLVIDGRRWFGYRSVYFDTPSRDAYRLAATRRPGRFKVRCRTYVDSNTTMAEIKTKCRRGATRKHRVELPQAHDDAVRAFARDCDAAAPYAEDLEPVLVSEYQRATLVLPSDGVRITIDRGYRCTGHDGSTSGIADEFIVETKTPGGASTVDRRLWRAGHRPVKISKFATGLAALDATLSANRWHRVLRTHFSPAVAAEHRERQFEAVTA